MTHVALTCPRLLFTIGMQVWPRLHRRPVDQVALRRALEAHGAVRSGLGWYEVELVDSVDVMTAWFDLNDSFDPDFSVQSIVGSAAAVELLLADPAQPAAGAAHFLRELVAASSDPDEIELDGMPVSSAVDFSRGCGGVRQFGRLLARPVPAPVTEQRLPDAPLVLWWIADGEIVAIDHAPYALGADLVFETTGDGWRVRSADSTCEAFINGAGSDMALAPGMVIQLLRTHVIVVLAVGPSEPSSSV